MRLIGHHAPTTNGAPQTVAVGFASLIFFSLLLPFARVSTKGALAPEALIQVLRTDAGFNTFALILLLAAPIGVLVALFARSSWRISTMAVALLALVMIPLAFMQLNHGLQNATHGTERVVPGLATYILVLGYAVLTITTGIVAFRARHSE